MSFPKPFYRWRPHPWHGLETGPNPPEIVHAYIEITPFDTMKYELDKSTGYLKVDRPQRTSSQPPALYGFIPKTYCGPRVGSFMKNAKRGDGDPLDICIISERPMDKAEVIIDARVIGGLPMLDHDEADDKIIAVVANDNLWSTVNDISELPDVLLERLRHYFLTYKMVPGEESRVTIDDSYGREQAQNIIKASIEDYHYEFGD